MSTRDAEEPIIRETMRRQKYLTFNNRVRRQAGCYLVTTPESVTELDDVMQLAAFADAIYADHWIGRKITPSA